MKRSCLDCGIIYDDFDHRTICPHEFFPASPSAVAAIKKLKLSSLYGQQSRLPAIDLNYDDLAMIACALIAMPVLQQQEVQRRDLIQKVKDYLKWQ